eukprot:4135855-Pleurochrysis_carterae.AAC.1
MSSTSTAPSSRPLPPTRADTEPGAKLGAPIVGATAAGSGAPPRPQPFPLLPVLPLPPPPPPRPPPPSCVWRRRRRRRWGQKGEEWERRHAAPAPQQRILKNQHKIVLIFD